MWESIKTLGKDRLERGDVMINGFYAEVGTQLLFVCLINHIVFYNAWHTIINSIDRMI